MSVTNNISNEETSASYKLNQNDITRFRRCNLICSLKL